MNLIEFIWCLDHTLPVDHCICLLGNPVLHSLSPKIFTWLFAEYKIKGSYELNLTTTSDWPERLSDLLQKRFSAYNLTTPVKSYPLPHWIIPSEIVTKTGATNCLWHYRNIFFADNTDGGGFLLACDYLNIDLTKKNILILGNGATATAIYLALKNKKAHPKICARKKNKLEFDFHFSDLANLVGGFDLIINATTMGNLAHDWPNLNWLNQVPKQTVIFDCNYATASLKTAATPLGISYVAGHFMLIGQALLAFENFTQIKTCFTDFKKLAVHLQI